MKKGRWFVLGLCVCLCFLSIFGSGCALRTKNDSTTEISWTDENVDEGGWT